MFQGRFGGLLLAVMFAASTLQVAVDARRTFNKCCAPNEHLYYNTDSGVFECKTASQSAERAKRVADVNGKSKVIEDDDDAEFGKFLAKLHAVSNLTRDDVVAGVIPSCVPNDVDWLFNFSLRATHDAVTLDSRRNHALPAHAWCVDVDDVDYLMVVLCPCADASRPCVRKCCKRRGEALDKVEEGCIEADGEPWTPTTQTPNMTYYQLNNKMPRDSTCQPSIEAFHRDQLTLLPDGSMKGVDTAGRDTTFKPGRYCVDASYVADPDTTNGIDVDGEQLVLFCVEVDKISNVTTVFKGVITLLGALALLITVVLTAIFPELLESINSKMALCHNASLLGAFICIGVSQVSGGILNQVTCKLLSFVIQFTLLAAFFWLNAICVEVSWVFGALRPVKRVMVGYVDGKFRWYSLYAWGSTALISIITMLVEFVPGAQLKPRFGEANCFFHGDDKIPPLLFLYGPMAILLAINLGLFIFTATRIITHRKQTSILNATDSTTNNRNNQNLILYIKLFTLMGVTWVFEIVSWVVGGKNYYWLPIDCINLLRGIFIFFIFCCKRSVLDLVRERLGCAGAAVPHVQSSAGTKPTALTNNGFENMADGPAIPLK